MKSEKKSNDSNRGAVPNRTAKEEPSCSDACKMNEKNSGEIPEVDAKPNCNRESNLASTNSEDTANSRGNKQSSSSVKLENDSSYSTCNLSNDCEGSPGPKSTDANAPGKCRRNGCSGGESQFVQQQNQVFVFSTILANKGAEAVIRGQFPSIVAYHCAQPGTRKFLEKYPSKGIKSGQSPSEWLNSFNSAGQKNQQACNSLTCQTPELPGGLDRDPSPFWTEQSNTRHGNGEKSIGTTESSVGDTINKIVNPQATPHSRREQNCSSPSTLQPSLQGVKVPDENLTAQQRQHREESLAALRKMQMLLFPDKKKSSDSFLDTNQGTQAQNRTRTRAYETDDLNTPPMSPLNRFSPDVDWETFSNQLLDQKNKAAADNYTAVSASGLASISTNLRNQGSTPPYIDSSRPASVPTALQSPNPSSPNNPMSTLSLPSPRASSALNSPADYGNRQFIHHGGQRPGYLTAGGSPMTQESLSSGIGMDNHLNRSNPGTPGSQTHLVPFSPGGGTKTQKDSIDFGCAQSPSVDELLCQTLQSVDEEQHDQVASAISVTDVNLMPVPSPQQIQYLNTFEGHEMTIQKQPNASMKDKNSPSNSSASVATSGVRISPESGASLLTENTDRRFTDPLRSPRAPRTSSQNAPFDTSSMTTAAGERMKSEQNSPASYGQNLSDSIARARMIPGSPKPKDVSPSVNRSQYQLTPVNCNDAKMRLHSNDHDFPCCRPPMQMRGRPENLPLNPNNMHSCISPLSNRTANHFDPITSLAQMSQQLSNITPINSLRSGNPAGIQQNTHSTREMNPPSGDFRDVGGFGSGSDGSMPTNYNPALRSMNLGISNRPPMAYGPMNPNLYHGEHRLAQRLSIPDPHNTMQRTNVHVRQAAPSTIQYLPTANPSNTLHGGPRGPPSLDFLHAYTAGAQSQRCCANNMAPHSCSMHNVQRNVAFPGINSRLQRPPGGFQIGPSYHHNHMRPQMIPGVHQGPSPIRVQHMIGGSGFHGSRISLENKPYGSEMMPQMSNPRMFIPGGNPANLMGMRPRGAMLMQHGMRPNVNAAPGSNNFNENAPFIGSTRNNPTLDPHYAQQYHNFQQQLYATGTRPSGSTQPTSNLRNHTQGTNSTSSSSSSSSFLPER